MSARPRHRFLVSLLILAAALVLVGAAMIISLAIMQ